MAFIELKNYHMPPDSAANVLAPFDFSLDQGDVCAVQADISDLGHQFLNALSMISAPMSGEYCSGGRCLQRQRYPEWLQHRRRVAYIGPVSALISNMSIRENLLLSRFYYENDLRLELSEEVTQLCHAAGLGSKLSLRPADLNALERRIAIAIRELTRDVSLVVLDNTEDLIGHPTFRLLMAHLRRLHRKGAPLVMMSESENPIRQMINRCVAIVGGHLRERACSPNGRITVS